MATRQAGQPTTKYTFTLKRDCDDGKGISGTLHDESGRLLMFTLEPSLKVPEHPGIPVGTYPLAFTLSNRLKKKTLEVGNVKGRAGIRIHSLNYPYQSLGCIGVGTRRGNGMVILNSRPAVNALEDIICPRLELGHKVFLKIA